MIVNMGTDYVARADSVGKVLAPVVDLRFVGPGGDDVAPGEVGEIWISGPTIVRGYHNNPEATAAAFTDGWFHTGDLGYVDEDGFVHVVDRLKDVVIRGGENVYAAEVEAALFEHPDISDAAVVGVPHPPSARRSPPSCAADRERPRRRRGEGPRRRAAGGVQGAVAGRRPRRRPAAERRGQGPQAPAPRRARCGPGEVATVTEGSAGLRAPELLHRPVGPGRAGDGRQLGAGSPLRHRAGGVRGEGGGGRPPRGAAEGAGRRDRGRRRGLRPAAARRHGRRPDRPRRRPRRGRAGAGVDPGQQRRIPDAQYATKMPVALVDDVIGTNLRGPFLLSCEVARRLIERRAPGRIVNLSSMGAHHYAGTGAALYSTTKAAVERMTETLAVEWARFGINVNAIAPGALSSEMMDGMISRVGDITRPLPPRGGSATRRSSTARCSTSCPRRPSSSPA